MSPAEQLEADQRPAEGGLERPAPGQVDMEANCQAVIKLEVKTAKQQQEAVVLAGEPSPPLQPTSASSQTVSDTEESRLSIQTESEHFEIVWSNLSYRIEPKWYKKFNYIDRIFSHFASDQTIDAHSSATSTASSGSNMQDEHAQRADQMSGPNSMGPLGPEAPLAQEANSSGSSTTASCATSAKKSPGPEPIEIFTNLNGTIKSGQMTAVLGPSGEFCWRPRSLFGLVARAQLVTLTRDCVRVCAKVIAGCRCC